MAFAFQTVLDAGYRKAMANVTKWMERVVALPEFVSVSGNVKFCHKVIAPTLVVPKKEEVKVAAPVKHEETAEKKEKNPLDLLPPTTFNLYDFKTFFVNCPDKVGLGMKTFFE